MDGNKKLIELKNLTKSFGERKVLDGVSLEVFQGETLVIIGRSGVGKSTVLKHIAGLLAPDAGEIWVEGLEVGRLGERDLNERVEEKNGRCFPVRRSVRFIDGF